MATAGGRPVSGIEPMLLFAAAAVFAAIVIAGLFSGWVWIPGSPRGSGSGFWANRSEDLRDYVVYLVIMTGAALGVLAMAVSRQRELKAQRRLPSHDSLSDRP